MEFLDVYNKDKELTGKVIPRAKGKPELEPGEYIRIIIIFIQNSKNELLIQMTSKEKGSIWATTGGLVSSGDTVDKTVIKEVQEELGLDISNEDVKHIGCFEKGVAFFDVYYLKKDIDIKDITYQKEEVEYVKWLSFDEIDALISEDKFRPGHIPGLNLLKDYLNNN